MPQIHPVHYQTHPLAAYCGASTLNPGTDLVLGTSDPGGVTCSKCVMTLPSLEDCTPITEEEHAALIRSARGKLREAIEPLDDWLERRRIEDERRYLHHLALEQLYIETPWWALRTRRFLRRALAGA